MAFDRYVYAYNSPLNYTDPSGHSPDCWDDGYACGADPGIVYERPNSDEPPTPGQKAAEFLSHAVLVIDGGALVLSGVEAVVVDTVGVVAIGAGIVVTSGSGPVGGVVLGEAVKYTAMLDFSVTTTSPLGLAENFLGVTSFGLTVLSDRFAGNSGLVMENGVWNGGVEIGNDTIVAGRNLVAGLIPEANIDTAVSASQFWYDLQRVTGEKHGGSIVVYGQTDGWKGWSDLFTQALFQDWR